MHDDTAAFQHAIDALPSDGGTIDVPKGTYLLDAVKSVRLRSRMHLQLARDAKLVAKPNNVEKAYVLYVYMVTDTEISGGRIVGERSSHLGTTGEWGHGIQIRGASRITVRDMHISNCWGDGICIGAAKISSQPKIPSRDVVISTIVSTGNRRQGLSIGGSRQVLVFDSEFSDTSGTAPSCGIDVEPDGAEVMDNVHIENCLVSRNEGNGIVAYKRVNDVTIKRCLIEYSGGYGILTIGASNGSITRNKIRHNFLHGAALRAGTRDFVVSGNTFRNNHTRLHGLNMAAPQWVEMTGLVEGKDGNGANIQVTRNTQEIRVTDNVHSA